MRLQTACIVCGRPGHGTRCPKHEREHMQRRGPSGWDWSRLRQRVLERDMFMCQKCGARATDVDHKVPLANGGTNDLRNLWSLCGPCHDRKTYGPGNRSKRTQQQGRR